MAADGSSGEGCRWMGVSVYLYVAVSSMRASVADIPSFNSTPGVALQYEKFYVPDEIRILDAILETLAY